MKGKILVLSVDSANAARVYPAGVGNATYFYRTIAGRDGRQQTFIDDMKSSSVPFLLYETSPICAITGNGYLTSVEPARLGDRLAYSVRFVCKRLARPVTLETLKLHGIGYPKPFLYIDKSAWRTINKKARRRMPSVPTTPRYLTAESLLTAFEDLLFAIQKAVPGEQVNSLFDQFVNGLSSDDRIALLTHISKTGSAAGAFCSAIIYRYNDLQYATTG